MAEESKSPRSPEERAEVLSPSPDAGQEPSHVLDETLPPSWIRDGRDGPGDSAGIASTPPGPLTGKDVEEVSGDSQLESSASAELREFPSHVPAAGFDLPMRFGEYELLEEVARGGMGVVFRANQVNLDRQVALKMILSGKLANEGDVQRFYSEASSAASLEHPGVVPVYEVGEENGQHFFSMGFVEGESLAALIGRNPLSPQKSAQMVLKIAEAIVYAHGQGVIHRDLKPANVLLDRKNSPHISDFGLAKKITSGSDLTVTGQILGTPSYMSPEQASGETDRIGESADVYSLGAILYCCLTGRAPFQAANPMETLRQVVEREPVPPRQLNFQVDLDLDTICLKCLEKDPQRRYGSAQELADELNRFIDGQPILARRISTLDRSFRWCRRNPGVTSLLAALLLAIVGGISGVTWKWLEADYQKNLALAAQESEMDMDSNASEKLDDIDQERELAEVQWQIERQDFRDAQQLITNWTKTVLGARDEVHDGPGGINWLRDSLGYFQLFIERHGTDEVRQLLVMQAHSISGQIRVALDNPEAALESYRQVLFLLEKPVKWIENSGRHVMIGITCFESARLHGLLNSRIQASGEYTVAEKERLNQKHHQQIQFLLNESFAHGYFSSEEHLERLQNDEYLLAFRQRAEFARLIKAVQRAKSSREK